MAGRSSGRDERIRVLTLVQGIGVSGGGERLAREVTKELDPERFDRTLCVSRWDPSERENPRADRAVAGLREAGVRFFPLERSSRYELATRGTLLRALRRWRIDVVHAHMWGSNVWGTVLGRLARTPVIVAHEHTWSFQGQPLRRFLDREVIARGSDAFIAVSREDRRRMIGIERIRPEDVVFIPNGIPTPPPATGKDVRAEFGIDAKAPLIGSVGVLRPQKRFDVLIRAAAELRRTIPDARFLIVGFGQDEAELRCLIDRLGLAEAVVLAGVREDVPDVIAAFDVAVNCSDFEGSPLAVMEYMEAALPIVATRVGGVPDLIDDGVNGLLVDPGQPQALAAAIETLLADPDRCAEMGEVSRRRRRSEFSLTAMTRSIEGLYEELFARSTRR